MASIQTKLEVTGLTSYKKDLSAARSALKLLDAELKLCEAAYQTSGDKAQYLSTKMELLKRQVQAQQQTCALLQAALNQVSTEFGANSTQANSWRTKLVSAKTTLISMQAQLVSATNKLSALNEGKLDDVDEALAGTKEKATETGDAMASIAEKLDRDSVVKGLESITDAMSSIADKAINLGRSLWSSTAGAADWANNLKDSAEAAGVSAEGYQRMAYAAQYFNTSADAIVAARKKIMGKIAGADPENSFLQVTEGLNVALLDTQGNARNWIDVLFDVFDTLGSIEDQTAQEAAAQDLFGNAYTRYLGLIRGGREEFMARMREAPVVPEEQVESMSAASEALTRMNAELDALKLTGLSALAPSLEIIGNGISSIASGVREFLETEEGRQQVEKVTESITKLVESFTVQDVSEIVSGVSSAITGMTDALDWLSKHSDGVVSAIRALFVAFMLLKTATLGLNIAGAIGGLKGMLPGAAGSAAAGAGASAGGSAAGTAAAGAGGGLLAKGKGVALAALNAMGQVAVPFSVLAASYGGFVALDRMATERNYGADYEQFVADVGAKTEGATGPIADLAESFNLLNDAFTGEQGVADVFKLLGPDFLRELIPADSELWSIFDRMGDWSAAVDEYAPSFDDAGDAMKRLGAILLDDGLPQLIESLAESLDGSEEAAAAADNTTEGFVAEIMGSLGEYREAGIAAGSAFDEGFRGALSIESPSKVMEKLAEYTTAGFVEGIDNTLGDVESASYRMAAAAAFGPVHQSARAGDTYNSSSALYVDKYYQRSDADINAVSAAIAAGNTRKRRGYGGR